MNGKRIALLNPKRGENFSVFQYFLDERAYWNALFDSSPSSSVLLSLIFDEIMPYILSFVKKKRVFNGLQRAMVLRPLGGLSRVSGASVKEPRRPTPRRKIPTSLRAGLRACLPLPVRPGAVQRKYSRTLFAELDRGAVS